MILDTSVIVAITLDEPRGDAAARIVEHAASVGVGTPTLVECGLVLAGRRGAEWRTLLDEFFGQAPVAAVPFSAEHWSVAMNAFERFGKGRHPARLNFGDCLVYAVARIANQPLLYIGDDFGQTDLEVLQP